jgi:hypothetical protein
MSISESDWKILRQLRPVALDRLCQRILSECVQVASAGSGSAHERYLELFKLIENRDEELGLAFDNPRRSTGMLALIAIHRMGLLTEVEFGQFSREARETVLRALDRSS